MAGGRELGLRRRRAPRAQRSGYTLMEVLVVLSITAVMSLMALPFLQERDEVNTEVRRLVGDLVRARSWARTTWRETTFDYDVAGRRWRVVDATGVVLPGDLADADGWRTLDQPMVFQAVVGVAGDAVFQASGRCPEPSEMRVSNGRTAWRLRVSELTGSVTAEPVGAP